MRELERQIIDISYRQKLSHLSSCLSALPIIEKIYSVKKPDERFVLSSGHAHLAHAVVMEQCGDIPSATKAIKQYGIHCDIRSGCDVSTGSLGMGLPIALGMAMSDRSKDVYCLISDGEAAEGSILESLRIKREFGIDNLKVYCNANGFGAYREIDQHLLSCQLHLLDPKITMVYPKENSLPGCLTGQQGHYRILSDQDYEKCMGFYGN